MKDKIIKGIISVYVSVSLVYGGARAALLLVVGAPSLAREMNYPTGLNSMPSELTQEINNQINMASESGDANTENIETEESANYANEDILDVEDNTEDEYSEVIEDTEITYEESSEDIIQDSTYEDNQQEEEYIEPEPTEYIPSLYEYLSQYTCGHCRRYCSLCNPHCHTGARKADNISYEYYEIYGDNAW